MKAPLWSWAAPAATALFAGTAHLLHLPIPLLLVPVAAVLLFAAVFAAVHHAEVIAHRLGDPYGSIILAVAVTIIEVALIVAVLPDASSGQSAIARDTVFAAIMIVLNGIVGLCLLVGSARYTEQGFQARGATASLGVLGTLAVLGLVLPNFTQTASGPVYSPFQLTFVAVVSLGLYALFLFVQTVRHQGDFRDAANGEEPHDPPDASAFRSAMILLPLTLMAVVLMAETLTPLVEGAVKSAGLPQALVGVAIAMVVLLPEGLAAFRAARANRLQTSLNLALGSALASICLTIPAVAAVSLWLDRPLVMGLEAKHIVLLVLSLFMATLSLATGRTTVLQGAIHLVIFGAFLTFAAVP